MPKNSNFHLEWIATWRISFGLRQFIFWILLFIKKNITKKFKKNLNSLETEDSWITEKKV